MCANKIIESETEIDSKIDEKVVVGCVCPIKLIEADIVIKIEANTRGTELVKIPGWADEII